MPLPIDNVEGLNKKSSQTTTKPIEYNPATPLSQTPAYNPAQPLTGGQAPAPATPSMSEQAASYIKSVTPPAHGPATPAEQPKTYQARGTAIEAAKPATTYQPRSEVMPKKEEKPTSYQARGEVMPSKKTPEAEVSVSQVSTATSGYKHTSNLDELSDITMKMARGEVDDPVYSKALNNYVANIGLYNQADIEAVNQQIANDPDLRGSGLGYALLAQAGREAGFRVSDQLSKLSVESMDRLINMQKFGIQTAFNLDQERDNRRRTDIQTMINTGNFAGAAKAMDELFSETFPGMNINVNPDDLAARDPFTLEQFSKIMNDITGMAKPSPETATAMLQDLMSDPRYAGWFGDGMTAEGMIDAIVSGEIEANQPLIAGVQTEITMTAGSEGTTLSSARDQYKILSDNGKRQGFIESGRTLTLEEVNELRAKEGIPEWTQDDFDAAVIDDREMEELGWMADFYRRKDNSKAQSMERKLIQAMEDSPYMDQWLKDDPDGMIMDAINKWAFTMSFNPDVQIDPKNGQVTLDAEDMETIIGDPKNYHLFYDWPKAYFDKEGNVSNTVYWGNRVLNADERARLKESGSSKLAEDAYLDKKWMEYVDAGGDLTAREWYFASAGGRYSIDDPQFDQSRVPENMSDDDLGYPDLPDEPMFATGDEVYTPPGGGGGLKSYILPPFGQDELITQLQDYVRLGQTDKITEEMVQALPVRLSQRGDDTTNGIPIGNGVKDWLAQHAEDGGYINIQGTGFRVIEGGGGVGHTDFALLEDMYGNKWTFDEKGDWHLFREGVAIEATEKWTWEAVKNAVSSSKINGPEQVYNLIGEKKTNEFTKEMVQDLPVRLPQKGTDETNGIPVGTGVSKWLADHAEDGGYINIQGTGFRVISGGGGSGRIDFVLLEDMYGNKWSFTEKGLWYSGWDLSASVLSPLSWDDVRASIRRNTSFEEERAAREAEAEENRANPKPRNT